jgi:hypothetical protein
MASINKIHAQFQEHVDNRKTASISRNEFGFALRGPTSEIAFFKVYLN